MGFIKTPVKGTNDFLPAQMRIRQKVLEIIRANYASYGFSEIETPTMEHIENLTSNQGGENEKLIFKIMKRGAELERAIAGGKDFADSGLRYDLTLPLSRFYAANADNLTAPFKALQIGSVYRADRPQKGRFRQFMQCDIDILGDPSFISEIELISATSNTLLDIFSHCGINEFTVHINDRRILAAMAAYSGIDADKTESVFITLDKMDKIGKDGVKNELIADGFSEASVEKYLSLFAGESDINAFADTLSEFLPAGVFENLSAIMKIVRGEIPASVKIVFDPTLVRGMGYYTGTIFEITIDNYNFSIAGGGRYDEMIGKFSGQKVPACGFSIGFERIITILSDLETDFDKDSKKKIAFLIENGVSEEKISEVFKKAVLLRKDGNTVSVQPMKKNAKHQIDKLMAEGFGEVNKIYKD